MRITLVVAMDRTGLIGSDGALPWRLPGDLKRFRSATMGKPIIMGRKTFASIGRVLPGRLNIILTTSREFPLQAGAVAAHSVEEALLIAWKDLARTGEDEAMIVGGAEVYRIFLPRADRMHLTIVDGEFVGTTRFPIEQFNNEPFTISSENVFSADEINPHSCRVLLLERNAGSVSASRFVFPQSHPT